MSDSEDAKSPANIMDDVRSLKIEPDGSNMAEDTEVVPQSQSAVGQTDSRRTSTTDLKTIFKDSPNGVSVSPKKSASLPQSPAVKSENEEVVGGEITVKMEPGEPPKLARSTSKTIVPKARQTFLDWPDATAEAKKDFEHLQTCIYANKHIGTTEHDAMECDCQEKYDPQTKINHACGDDDDCINRACKMECSHDCNCGPNCANQRFQRQLYADVSVIKTEKKGYGLRTNQVLRKDTFIFEYIGEVIGEAAFRRRMVQYDEEGIKHFYFMSLNKGEFVDATKRGNLGRFCNHSCNPNCYVDKWVVGDKLRMGIFADRKILAGEELVFNYNVDRYGANPQPCYCGEPNCTGFIGGKTQTERATKLPLTTIEALGIDDGDGWDMAVPKKARKKKAGEDDEEYVDRVQPKPLDEDGVVKVMATLMQCKEKWICVKLLSRIQKCEELRALHRVVKMHGYSILKAQLTMWMADDTNIVFQIFDILKALPRLTRNKINDAGIEETMKTLEESENEDIKEQAAELIKIWSDLPMGYRIPRHNPNMILAAEQDYEERRKRDRSKSRSRSVSPAVPKGPSAPSGPRGGGMNRGFHHRGPPPFRRNFGHPLPAGWFQTTSQGRTYYYSSSGQTTWQRPTIPAVQPPPPPKAPSHEQKLQELINSITSAPEEKTPASNTPKTEPAKSTEQEKETPKERWRMYDEDKRKKVYENTLAPHVMEVMSRFKGKLPKEDLKRFGKEVSKKLVASDFKNNRVEDPTQISSKQAKGIKSFTKDFFDKAVAKRRAYEKAKAEKEARKAKDSGVSGKPVESTTPTSSPPAHLLLGRAEGKTSATDPDDDDAVLSENEIDDDEPSPSTLDDPADAEQKRKREAEETPLTGVSPDIESSTPRKRMRSESEAIATPPPPPPPPPPSGPFDGDASDMHEEYDATLDTDTAMENHGSLIGKEVDDILPNGNAKVFTNFDQDLPTSDLVEGENSHQVTEHTSVNGE